MITVEQAREALKQAVEQRGEDYVYPNANGECVYNEGGHPSCIVGQAVYNIDPELFKVLAAEEERFLAEVGDGLIVTAIESLEFDFVAKMALSDAQALQDSGATWGNVLDLFEASVKNWKARTGK